MTEGWKPASAPYTETFQSIADAVDWREHHSFGISVQKFRDALASRGYQVVRLAAAPEPPRVSVEEVERLRRFATALEAGKRDFEAELYYNGAPIFAADLRSVLALIDMPPGAAIPAERP